MESIKPELFEAFKVLLYVVAIVALFLLKRTLAKIDANQTELFNRLNCLSQDFYTLCGEHNAIKDRCLVAYEKVVGRG